MRHEPAVLCLYPLTQNGLTIGRLIGARPGHGVGVRLKHWSRVKPQRERLAPCALWISAPGPRPHTWPTMEPFIRRSQGSAGTEGLWGWWLKASATLQPRSAPRVRRIMS